MNNIFMHIFEKSSSHPVVDVWARQLGRCDLCDRERKWRNYV